MTKENNFKIAVNELLGGIQKLQVSEKDEIEEQKTDFPTNFLVEKREPNKSSSVISEDLVIEGSVRGDSSIQILGTIKGDVSINGDVFAKGNIEGDLSGDNVVLRKCNLKGNVKVNRHISIDNETVVIGDISANNVDINGRVDGNINAVETVVLKKAAMVSGNISAKFASMESGAYLKGQMQVLSREDDINFTNEI